MKKIHGNYNQIKGPPGKEDITELKYEICFNVNLMWKSPKIELGIHEQIK